MKAASIFSILLLTVLAVDAISRRTDNLPFVFQSSSTLCNRNFNGLTTTNNNSTYTFNSDAACSGSASTSVGRATFSVSSFNGPAFTLQAFQNIGDATPQFSATLIFYNAFQYNSGVNHTTPEYNPNLDTIVASSNTLFFNSTAQLFSTPTMTSSSISGAGAPAGFNVNSFKFNSVLLKTIDITFYADIVSTATKYGDTVVNPNSLKVSVFVNNYPTITSNLAIGAYLITERAVNPPTTTGAVVNTTLQTSTTDNTGGSFSWDNIAFSSTDNTSNLQQPLFASSITQDNSFSKTGITSQPGNAQHIFFSANSTGTLTIVWDPTISYNDVGSFATRIQLAMITILIATFMGILL